MTTKILSIFGLACSALFCESPVRGQNPQTDPVIPVVAQAEIRIRQVATTSIGDKFAWKSETLPEDVGLTKEQLKLVAKCFNLRLDQREDSIEKCISSFATVDSSDRKSTDEFLAVLGREEASHEKILVEKLEEILLPKQYEVLVQSIIRADSLGFAEVLACADYLNLTVAQRTAFNKAREKVINILTERAAQGKSNTGVIPENDKIGDAIMSPVQSLTKSQLEKYLHSRKMIESELSLEDHYRRIGDEDRDKLKRMFPVFKSIEADLQKTSSK